MTITFQINRREIVRWLVGGILVWAAVSKLPNLQEFYGALAAYRLPVPAAGLRFVAQILPWLELFCGLLLLVRLWERAALMWLLILSVVFALAAGQGWVRGLDISCGCMNLDFLKGHGFSDWSIHFLESPPFAMIRAILLTAAAVYLFRERNSSKHSGIEP
jgi:hypothetical protein